MTTQHKIIINNSQCMDELENESINLIVTSPPYPMIEMWDNIFFDANKSIKNLFNEKQYMEAYEQMHEELNKTWTECVRVLKKGGIIAINIGDSTRTLDKNFQLFTNHVKIIDFMQSLGMQSLPSIIWRKTTNKPNKFMGSGMLPANAYVTLEHEYILIFRKGGKRGFNKNENLRRRESAFFWEERNIWFSDVWTDLVGESQLIDKKHNINRERNAAFPTELALRLINMYSIYGDTVLDPFLGTGTSMLAAAIAGRNSIGYEIDSSFKKLIFEKTKEAKKLSDSYTNQRVISHEKFINSFSKKRSPKYFNENINLPVITSQEEKICFYTISDSIKKNDGIYFKYKNLIRN